MSSSSKRNVCVEHVVVITADQELAWRCRLNARRDRRNTGYNSILRRLATGDNGFDYTTQKRGHKKKKGGRNKKSRSARKRQYMEQQNQKENEESTYDETEEVVDEQIMGNVTIENATTTHDQQELISIVSPQRFLEDLEFAMFEWFDQQQQEDNQHLLEESDNTRGSTDYADSSIESISIPSPISTLQCLFELRGQILTIESSLRKKCTLHKRQTLTGELRSCKKEWKEILSSLASATSGNITDGINYNGGGIRQSDLA